MTLPAFKIHLPLVTAAPNMYGETPLPFAPSIRLSSGIRAVPQQYLDVQRTLANLESVLAEIVTPKGFQLFAGRDGENLFLVTAAFGAENYPCAHLNGGVTKIVYGRRWLIEPTTTTSEVVQTAMLAVKKTREHELREKFTLTINDGQNITTPFNCHQDLPLMVGEQKNLFAKHCGASSQAELTSILPRVRINGLTVKCVDVVTLGERQIFDLVLERDDEKTTFTELNGGSLTVVCEQPSVTHFLHQLFNACLACSDHFVEEAFTFNGFARFSHKVSPEAIAEFSYLTRNVQTDDSRFDEAFKDMSYQVDSAKAPVINGGKLGQQQRNVIAQFPELAGYLPREPNI